MPFPLVFSACHTDCVRTRDARWGIDRVVVHTAEGTYKGTISWFKRSAKERNASYASATHYVLARTGEVTQMAQERDRLIHAGSKSQPGWNDRSIGIELEAWSGTAKPPSSIKFPVRDFPDVQIQSLAELIHGICTRNNIPMDRTHIVGHGEIPGQTHTDPGPTFPWDKLMAAVAFGGLDSPV